MSRKKKSHENKDDAGFIPRPVMHVDRPRCAKCGSLMWLVRIAPLELISPLKVSRVYECQCGEMLSIEEE